MRRRDWLKSVAAAVGVALTGGVSLAAERIGKPWPQLMPQLPVEPKPQMLVLDSMGSYLRDATPEEHAAWLRMRPEVEEYLRTRPALTEGEYDALRIGRWRSEQPSAQNIPKTDVKLTPVETLEKLEQFAPLLSEHSRARLRAHKRLLYADPPWLTTAFGGYRRRPQK